LSDYDFKVKNGLQVNGSISVNSTALYINNIPISANGSIGLSGQVFYSNGTVNYWADLPLVTPPGSNTQVMFNDAGNSNAVAGFAFDKTTNTVSIGSATINSTFFSKQSNTALTANNASYAYGKTENALNVNSAINANNSTYAYGKNENALNVNSASTANNSTYLSNYPIANLVTTTTTKTIAIGYTITPYNHGVIVDFTANAALGNYQYGTCNSAFVMTAPTSDCAIDMLITNGTGAGAVTLTGFTIGTFVGDPLTTTNGDKFIVSIRRINSVSTYSIKALQ